MKKNTSVSFQRRNKIPPQRQAIPRKNEKTPPKKIVQKKNENIPINSPKLTKPSKLQRYIKKDTLGEGAYGLVYQAFDQETGKTVAIKCLKTKESIESFQGELDLLKRLHHSAIVPYIDSFYDNKGNLQIVMEFADNGSILDVIHKYGNLNENVAAIYISQVLQGLSYLHKQNVIHRDIKAANILIQGGVAKLADFGLALDLKEYGHTLRECAGTPYWMAPEVINGDPVDHKSDIWSVGSTTIELLDGKPPFFDLAPLPAMFQIAGERPVPIPKTVSEKCKSFLQLCFQKNPKNRPEASELLKNEWIMQALKIVQQAQSSLRIKKKSHDFRSLSICLQSVCGNATSLLPRRKRTQEEIIFDLNEESSYLESVFNTIEMLNSKKGIPQLVLNFCGIRTLIDRLEQKQFLTVTLNFLQELVSSSDRIATSLIEHLLLPTLLNSEDVHSKITGMFIILSSNVGVRLFFASGLHSMLPSLFEFPCLKPFLPSFLVHIIKCGLPQILLISKIFTPELIKKLIETTFKSVALSQEYKKIIDKTFKNMKSLKSKEDLLVPRISNVLYEKSFNFIDDSISLLKYISSLSIKTKILLSSEMDPIVYLILKSDEFPSLTTSHIARLIKLFDSIFQDCVSRSNVRCDILIKPLITFSYSEDKNVAVESIKCLTQMLLNNPMLIEIAAEAGFCQSLTFSISRHFAEEYLPHLICYIPTVSKFAAYKMKEADLFYVLTEMISNIEWRDRSIHAIACWAKFDHKYIDQELVIFNERTEIFFELIEIAIKMIKNCHICLNSFYDLKSIIKRCKILAQSITNENLFDLIFSSLSCAGEYQKEILEFLLEVLLQASDPTIFASSILNKLKGYSESNNFDVQKIVLRIRVISGQ